METGRRASGEHARSTASTAAAASRSSAKTPCRARQPLFPFFFVVGLIELNTVEPLFVIVEFLIQPFFAAVGAQTPPTEGTALDVPGNAPAAGGVSREPTVMCRGEETVSVCV